MKYPLARPFITHSVGRFRCYLPRRNNEVFKYWLWLFFFPSFTSGQGWTLTLCLLYLCSADLGSFPVTIWAWRSFSDNIITKAKKGGNFLCVCVFHPHPVLWNSYFRVGVCTWEKLTNLTHSTRTRCHTPMTLKGIHFYICSLNAVLNYFAIVL